MDFFKPKVVPGWVLTLAGLTGSGKTHAANFISNPGETFFIDSHGTFSTIETLTLLGQQKVWRATEWTDLINATKEFLKVNKGKKATLVLDSGSELVEMAGNFVKARDNLKGIMNYAWGDVWAVIMGWLKMVVEAGHDLILTLQLKRIYEEFMDDKAQKVSIWTGEYEPKQWKDLPYQCTCQIQFEHGLTYPGQKAPILRNRVFTRLIKSRYAQTKETKPFIVGAITKANIAPQLLPYSGTFQECCWEMLLAHESDAEFCKEIRKVAGTVPPGWQPAPQQAPQGPAKAESQPAPRESALDAKEVPKKAPGKAKADEWG